MTTPQSSQTVGRIQPAQTDWLAVSKTITIEIAFLGSAAALLFGHLPPEQTSDALTVMLATGGTLGIFGIADKVANVLNVRAFLGAPAAQAAGVVPQAQGTPLLTTVPQSSPPQNGAA